MTNEIAIVIGGSERVWNDVSRAELFCHDHGAWPKYFACNDMIQLFPLPMTACTLHPDKLGTWMTQRQISKFDMPREVWAHDGGTSPRRPNPYVTNQLRDWGGSVGMFAYQVAREHDHDHVILCGVPMTTDCHFVRGVRWSAQPAFARSWECRRDEMRPFVRSMSGGWTEKLFGVPDQKWAEERVNETSRS
jgi:hypothetical protein